MSDIGGRGNRGESMFGVSAGGGQGGGLGELGAPVLSAPADGTPTSDGATAPTVTTDQGSGRLYWAVVTDGGAATTAQLKAGSGGNIVNNAGAHNNQQVNVSGVQTLPTITGLAAATQYQIISLHTNPQSLDSAQASVGLLTTA